MSLSDLSENLSYRNAEMLVYAKAFCRRAADSNRRTIQSSMIRNTVESRSMLCAADVRNRFAPHVRATSKPQQQEQESESEQWFSCPQQVNEPAPKAPAFRSRAPAAKVGIAFGVK